jgi:hypothetical protein
VSIQHQQGTGDNLMKTFFALMSLLAVLEASSAAHAHNAWAWWNEYDPRGGAPPLQYAYDSSHADGLPQVEGNIYVRKQTTGVYAVTFERLVADGANAGNVQVTAYDALGSYCKVSNWGDDGSGDLTVGVRCFSAAGLAQNTKFVVAFQQEAAGAGFAQHAYLWNDLASASGTPSTAYQHVAPISGSLATVTFNGVGTYAVTIPLGSFGSASATDNGIAHVTAYGTDPIWCNTAGHTWSGTTASVQVRCYTATGTPANSRFSLSFGRQAPFNAPDMAWAHTTSLSNSPYQLPSNEAGAACPEVAGVTSTRNSAGRYNVHFPGFDPEGPNRCAPYFCPSYDSTVIATAVSPAPIRCAVVSWGPDHLGGSNVAVSCFAASTSTSADTLFNVHLGTTARCAE